MKTAVLTGFEKFGRYAVNPTEVLARALDDEIVNRHRIRSVVFPTAIFPDVLSDYGTQLVEAAVSSNASAILSFGISSTVSGLSVEATCRNWTENDTYCESSENRRPLSTDHVPAEERHASLDAWDLDGLSSRLSQVNIQCSISTDAGGYCCNALMYRTLLALESVRNRTPFLFVHVPCTEEAVSEMTDFDRVNKVLWPQDWLRVAVAKLLESYTPVE